MGLFGKGPSVAMELRERILRALGAEEEWLERGDDGSVVWLTGLVATFFEVDPGFHDAPDLGVLTIYTPVAIAGDIEAAFHDCDRLNRQAVVSRWLFMRTGRENDEVALAPVCSFVVGPHNIDALTAFAIWCVREQIVTAVAALDAGIAEKVGDGSPYGWGPVLDREPRPEPHPVTMAQPYGTDDSERGTDILAGHAYDAYNALVARMADDGAAVWGTWADAEDLTFDVPFSWDDYPEGVISHGGEGAPLAAVVKVTCDDHPRAGSGLRFTMRTPWAPAPEDAERNVSALNSGGSQTCSHRLGAWALRDFPVEDARGTVTHTVPVYRYSVFLPASLADQGYGIDLPAVMREVLLTLARMALLVRQTLDIRDGLRDDHFRYIGLDAPYMTRGRLAWGETGEGRNPAALALDLIYERFVGADTDWVDAREDGFTWWPADYRQEFTVRHGMLQMLTPVRENVPVTAQALTAVARLNADLGSSALILTGNGELRLAASAPVGAPDERDFPLLALGLAEDQFMNARELRSALGDLGEPALSAHPFSGPRPADTDRFTARKEITPLAEETRPELTPRVALLALAGQLYLPHLISARGDGGLDFALRLSQFSKDVTGVLSDPLVRGSVYPVDSPAGPGWIVRMRLLVARDTAERAAWCNKQNKVLFSRAGETASLVVLGGWGVSPDGECCLSSRLPSFPGLTEYGRVVNLMRVVVNHVTAVRSALTRTKPDRVTSTSATPEELAAGLTRTAATLRSVLKYPADFRCELEASPVGVTLTMTAPAGDFPALAEVENDAERSVVLVPVSGNRTELAIAYAALLGRSASRIETGPELDLVPGELPGWAFTGEQIADVVNAFSDAGVLRWPPEGSEEDGAWALFPAGQEQGIIRFEVLPSLRLHGAAALLISAGAEGLTLPQAGQWDGDIDVLGTWRKTGKGVRYEVIVPPAGLLWRLDLTISELLTRLIRHVIRRVQSTILREAGDFSNTYPTSVEELLAHIEDRLTQGMDCRDLSAPAYVIAAELTSRTRLADAVRYLAGALRYSPNPRFELAAARKALADSLAPPPPPGRRTRRRERRRTPDF